MQVVILAGGSGTRLREETEFKPKPMIKIGPYPIIVHIMKHYAHYGFNDFIIAAGYRQEMIKEYFSHFPMYNNDIYCYRAPEGMWSSDFVGERGWVDFEVLVSDTGENTLKGGRLKKIQHYIKGDTFMLTYGDSVANVNIPDLLDFHYRHGKMVTITGVHPAPRFGEVFHSNGQVQAFVEKKDNDCYVNGGFMVMSRGIFDCLNDEDRKSVV